MQDSFGRVINYLRISVTDRCNLACEYCMPRNKTPFIQRHKILSYEEIANFVSTAVGLRFQKVRLTGGEPLMRKGIVSLVEMLAKIEGIEDLSMTTNGTLLSHYAKDLRAAGLHRINISIDTLSPQRYAKITNGGDLKDLLLGIEAAEGAGLIPIKLNCVIENSSEEPDAVAVANFAHERGYHVRFIRRMDIAAGRFCVVQGGSGGDCAHCNRLRLSSDGLLRPCLFSDISIHLREHTPEEAIRKAIHAKPERGSQSKQNLMYAIGG